MKIQYDPDFIKLLKQLNVRIRKSFAEKIRIFLKDPYHPKLNNHQLRRPYEIYRSINVTADYRALYEEVNATKDTIAYFVELGTHEQLYRKYRQLPES